MARRAKPKTIEIKNPPGLAVMEGSEIRIALRTGKSWRVITLNFRTMTSGVKPFSSQRKAEEALQHAREGDVEVI